MNYALLEGVMVTLIVVAAIAYAVWRWYPGRKTAAGCGSCKGCGPQAKAPLEQEKPVHFHR